MTDQELLQHIKNLIEAKRRLKKGPEGQVTLVEISRDIPIDTDIILKQLRSMYTKGMIDGGNTMNGKYFRLPEPD